MNFEGLDDLGDVGDFEQPPDRPDPFDCVWAEMKRIIDEHVIHVCLSAGLRDPSRCTN